MMIKHVVAVGAISLFVGCLFAQGLETKAAKTDWEEINFELNSSILSDGYPSLLRLAELLSQHRDYHVKVTGHTDSVGSARYNDKLALARANTVRDFLAKYGASPSQITTAGEGKRTPEVSNQTKEGRFMNRRVVLTVTDGQGRVVGEGGVSEAIHGFDELLKKQEECCSNILKRLDKLDEILAALRDLKGENDKLKSDLNDLRNAQTALKDQINAMPKPLTAAQTTEIAKEEGARALDEAARRNKKFSLLGLNIGPAYGAGRTGDFTFSGRGQFFSPFGGDGTHAVQAQGEYLYYPGRQEGQFDIGLVNRWDRVQAGLFSSFKFLNFRQFQNGGSLAQGAFTLDYLFNRGRLGIFGTKGFKNTAVLNRAQLGPNSFIETFARVVDQIGGSTQIGLWRNTYAEGNLGFLKRHGAGSDRPGGMLRLVHPLNDQFALTVEAGLNETLLNVKDSGRVVFGFQFGNFIRPKDYLNVKHPVPVDIPRIRYELQTRRIGNSAPVADAGPDQIGVKAGTITLDGSGSSDPDGDPLTFAWEQIAGPRVSISGMNTAKATFEAAEGQSYSFRLTVKDPGGLQSTARVTVSTLRIPDIKITRFSVTPDTITAGESAILEWVVENAETVNITPGIGDVRPSGTAAVSPRETTEFVLTARGNGKEARATVRLTVRPPGPSNPRIIRFEASPTNIMQGEAATLSWTTEGATRVEISGIGAVPANGSTVVTPAQTTTYTLTAEGPDGRQVTAPVIVTVGNGQVPRVVQFSVSPTVIDLGGSAQLCWSVENATEVSIAPGIGSVKATDCVTVSPAATTTFVLTARNAVGPIQASAVLVVGGVRILTFTSNPEFSPKAGDPVTLSWTTQNAISVTITGNGVPSGPLPVNGSIVVNPVTNSDYTLIAQGAGGQVATAVLHVFVR